MPVEDGFVYAGRYVVAVEGLTVTCLGLAVVGEEATDQELVLFRALHFLVDIDGAPVGADDEVFAGDLVDPDGGLP